MCRFISGSSIPLDNLCGFMLVTRDFHEYSCLVQLDIRDVDTSCSFFVVQLCFSYPYFSYEV